MSHHHYHYLPFLGVLVSKLVSGRRRDTLRNAESGLPPQTGAVLHQNSYNMEAKAGSEPPPAYVNLEPVRPAAVHMIPAMTDPPDNHMVYSILSTIFCCWPVGICAIIKSGEVDKAILRGDRSQAALASERAQTLARAALAIGLLIIIIYVIILIEVLRR